jgi:hypothetical protein
MRLFRQYANVTLDANGYGAVRLAPSAKTWDIRYLTVRVSTRVAESRVSIYDNFIGAQWLIDTTPRGSSGDTTDTHIHIDDGNAIWVVWEGGDPGATATVTYTGEEN